MSDQANTPSGNTPPGPGAPRVFRPFAGRPGQGTPPSNAPPPRQGGPRPFKPFAGRPVQEPVAETAIPVATMASQQQEAPRVDIPQEPVTPVETWEVQQPSVEAPPVEHPITVEVPIYEDRRETPASFEATAAPAERTTPVTRELPVFPDEEKAIAERIAAVDLPAAPEASADEVVTELAEELTAPEMNAPPANVPVYTQPEPDALDVPLFVAPSSEPAADSVIDEVDAAFISAGLPSIEPMVSDDALIAADTLTTIAERLRAGDIELRAAPGSNMSSQESVLATVLAALLANR